MPEPNASLEVSRRKRSACSSTVENFQSPQHHDGGRYQRGHLQHTFQGSDSHPYKLRFPAPSGGLVDSRNRRQSAGHIRLSFIYWLCLAGHTCFKGTHRESHAPIDAENGAGLGAFAAQWCQNSAIRSMIGSRPPSGRRHALREVHAPPSRIQVRGERRCAARAQQPGAREPRGDRPCRLAHFCAERLAAFMLR